MGRCICVTTRFNCIPDIDATTVSKSEMLYWWLDSSKQTKYWLPVLHWGAWWYGGGAAAAANAESIEAKEDRT